MALCDCAMATAMSVGHLTHHKLELAVCFRLTKAFSDFVAANLHLDIDLGQVHGSLHDHTDRKHALKSQRNTFKSLHGELQILAGYSSRPFTLFDD